MPTITGVTVLPQISDTASGNTAPAVTTGQSIPVDSEGWVLLVQFDAAVTIADPTKLTVNITRPGYTNVVAAAATTRADVAYGTKQLRRVHPNTGSPLLPGAANAFHIQIDNLLHASDVISGLVFDVGFFTGQSASIPIGSGLVTRSDSLTYAKPMCQPAFLPYRRIDASNLLAVEFVPIHEWAAFGQQVARVEARVKSGATYGAWSGSGTQTKSAQTTPASGRNPGGLSFDSFSFTVDATGVPNGAAEIVWRAYGWFGDVIFDSETDGVAYPSMDVTASWPVVIDRTGAHSPIYIWVNRDGTGLTSGTTGVSTGTSDPGSSLSYTNFVTALTAARAYNNANRGHNTTSGAVILLRDIAGGALGQNGTAYWQRANCSGYSDGLIAPVISSASYLTTGLPTLNCRVRGVQDDGTTVPAIGTKYYTGRWEYRGLTLDAIGASGGGQQIFDGTTSNTGNQQFVVDCDIRGLTSGGTSTPLYRSYYRFDVRVDEGGLGTGEGTGNQVSWNVMMMVLGSRYQTDTAATMRGMNVARMFAAQLTNVALFNSGEMGVFYSVRVDGDARTSSQILLGAARPIIKGLGICNLFARAVNPSAAALLSISADTVLWSLNNVVLQHITTTGQRENLGYGDQGWIYIQKRLSQRYSAAANHNNKSDYFGAPETAASLATGWAASTAYLRGQIVHDNNATTAARICYQALTDHTSGTTQATDLANSTLWQTGTTGPTAFGSQPRRTGNWRFRNAVRCWGNVFATGSNGSIVDQTSYMGEVVWRGGAISTAESTYYKATSTALASLGDYRPRTLASGDANDSPLLSRVASGAAVTPNDIIGNPRLNNGSGAAGAFEAETIANGTAPGGTWSQTLSASFVSATGGATPGAAAWSLALSIAAAGASGAGNATNFNQTQTLSWSVSAATGAGASIAPPVNWSLALSLGRTPASGAANAPNATFGQVISIAASAPGGGANTDGIDWQAAMTWATSSAVGTGTPGMPDLPPASRTITIRGV